MHLPAELSIARGTPPAGSSLAEAQRYTRWLATHHYENFNVVSWLLPRRLHQHFYNLYAYCRWADDLGDEVADPARALELLNWWEHELHLCYEGRPSHPVFIALEPTIRACQVPMQPFADLLVAFRQDQTVKRYSTWQEVLGYCRYSADPVGRLVLYLCGYRDAGRQELSDFTCTALQLANFWQDVARDLAKGRIYVPLDRLEQHGLTFADIEQKCFDERYVSLMKDLIASTRELFAAGLPLAERVDPVLRVDIELFSRGGLAVLEAIGKTGYDTLHRRPALGRGTQAKLLGRAMFKRALGAITSRNDAASPRQGSAALGRNESARRTSAAAGLSAGRGMRAPRSDREASASYEECRRVARNASSNFYYSFFLLPRSKRDALCALYAFMRLVDDVSDTPGELAEKQRGLARWRALLDAALTGDASGHPILPAFRDTVERYEIPARYFHDLISGAEMDLTVNSYATFDRLREYCYRVAGTVGLTCLHVFGFRDPRAPDLAEKLGIGFQLTNILRDLPKDFESGRVYLPDEDWQRFACNPADLKNGIVSPALAELLAFEADRAWQYYEEGAALVSQVDRESRASLWALARTYSALLARIEERDYDVFTSRVRLSTAEKMKIVLRAGLGGWSEKNVLEERPNHRRRAGGPFLRRRAG